MFEELINDALRDFDPDKVEQKSSVQRKLERAGVCKVESEWRNRHYPPCSASDQSHILNYQPDFRPMLRDAAAKLRPVTVFDSLVFPELRSGKIHADVVALDDMALPPLCGTKAFNILCPSGVKVELPENTHCRVVVSTKTKPSKLLSFILTKYAALGRAFSKSFDLLAGNWPFA